MKLLELILIPNIGTTVPVLSLDSCLNIIRRLVTYS